MIQHTSLHVDFASHNKIDKWTVAHHTIDFLAPGGPAHNCDCPAGLFIEPIGAAAFLTVGGVAVEAEPLSPCSHASHEAGAVAGALGAGGAFVTFRSDDGGRGFFSCCLDSSAAGDGARAGCLGNVLGGGGRPSSTVLRAWRRR